MFLPSFPINILSKKVLCMYLVVGRPLSLYVLRLKAPVSVIIYFKPRKESVFLQIPGIYYKPRR